MLASCVKNGAVACLEEESAADNSEIFLLISSSSSEYTVLCTKNNAVASTRTRMIAEKIFLMGVALLCHFWGYLGNLDSITKNSESQSQFWYNVQARACSSVVERLSYTQLVAGSNPAAPTMNFTIGNFFKEQTRNGWIYGSFMPEGPHKDDRVEIKMAVWKKGQENEYHSQKTATKIDLILEGEVVWEIDGEDVGLKKGDYVIVPPLVKARVKEIVSDEALVETIKFPSLPDDRITY